MHCEGKIQVRIMQEESEIYVSVEPHGNQPDSRGLLGFAGSGEDFQSATFDYQDMQTRNMQIFLAFKGASGDMVDLWIIPQ